MLLNIDKPFRRGMLHSDFCSRIPSPLGTQFKPIERLGRDGGWFSVDGEAQAVYVLAREYPAGALEFCPDCTDATAR